MIIPSQIFVLCEEIPVISDLVGWAIPAHLPSLAASMTWKREAGYAGLSS